LRSTDSVAIDHAIESTFVGGPRDEHARRVGRLFEDSFDLLSRAGCQAITIACNTGRRCDQILFVFFGPCPRDQRDQVAGRRGRIINITAR
jgi:hypothetical protein